MSLTYKRYDGYAPIAAHMGAEGWCIGTEFREGSPVRHPANRRLKTIIQELIYLAARLVKSGRRLKLRFGRLCPAFGSFDRVYERVAFG